MKANVQIKRQNSISVNGGAVHSDQKNKASVSQGINTSVKKTIRTVQSELKKTDDTGLQSTSQGIALAKAGAKTFKASQATTSLMIGTAQAAKKAAPTVIKTAKGVGKGVYIVAGKTIKVVKRVDSTLALLQTGAIVINKETAAQLINYTKNRIISSRPAVKLVNAVGHVKTAGKNAWKYTVQTGRNIQRTAILARGVVLGTVKIQISKETRERIKNTAIKGVKFGLKTGATGVKFGLKTGATGVVKGVKFGLKTTAKGVYIGSIHAGKGLGKGLKNGLRTTESALMNTDDDGIQAAGMALKGIHYTVKGAAYTPKVTKIAYKGIKGTAHTGYVAVKGGVNTFKGVKIGLKRYKKLYKKVGVSKATKMYAKRWGRTLGGKARKGFAKAGHSVVTAAVDALKGLGKKMIIPLILVLIVVACASTIINSVAGVVAAILSPFISDDSGDEIDETQLITQEITDKRTDLIDELKNTYNDNSVTYGGSYHFVRFYNTLNDTEIEFTDSNIDTSIYTVNDYVETIQPVFHAIIMCEYEGAASASQMEQLITEMWDLLNVIQTEEQPTEYCNMVIGADGTITPIEDVYGIVHADASVCPNHSADVMFHADTDDGTSDACDSWYYICNGHQGSCTHVCNDDCEFEYICGGRSLTHLIHNESCKRYYCGHTHSEWISASSPGCYSTSYCNDGNPLASNCSNGTKHKSCAGYYECYGHKILALTITINSFDDLMNKYFLDEINTLEAQATRTEEEETRLNMLRDSYDICISYLTILEEEYGYSILE